MAQRHALRLALGARGEEDHRHVVGLRFECTMDQPRRQALQGAERLVEAGDLLPDIFEIDDAPPLAQGRDLVIELALIDEAARGDDGLELSQLRRRAQVANAGREVQQRRHAAIGEEREQRHRHALHVRQQHADLLLRRRQRRELAPQHQRAKYEPAIGDRLALRIFQRDAALAMAGDGLKQGAKDRDPRARGVKAGGGHVWRVSRSAFPLPVKLVRSARVSTFRTCVMLGLDPSISETSAFWSQDSRVYAPLRPRMTREQN